MRQPIRRASGARKSPSRVGLQHLIMDKLNGAGCACIGMNYFAKADGEIVKAQQSRAKTASLNWRPIFPPRSNKGAQCAFIVANVTRKGSFFYALPGVKRGLQVIPLLFKLLQLGVKVSCYWHE